jgi:hypothetical protein
MSDKPKSPLIWHDLLMSMMISAPFVGFGYAGGRFDSIWLLGAVVWYALVGLIVSFLSWGEG